MTNKGLFWRGCLVFSVLFGSYSCENNDRQLDAIQIKVDSLSGELKVQQQISDSLRNELSENDDFQIFFGRDFEDIQNPEAFIREELREHPELIPLEPVLGGTMEFRQIEILTEEWLLAIYDDGHIQGKTIFQYELQPDGEINFSPVVSDFPQ